MFEEPRIWERQPYESEPAYQAFLIFRDMPKPRSVDGAYRLHMARKKAGASPESVAPKQASGGWRCWSRGENFKGKPVEGTHTWEKRVIAYDIHIDRQLEAEFNRQLAAGRVQLIRQEVRDYTNMLTRFVEIWERTRVHDRRRSHRIKEKDENGEEREIEVVVAELNVDEYLKLAKLRNLLSEFGRRAHGLPERTIENKLEGGSNPLRILFEWDDNVDDNSGHDSD